MTQKKQIPTLQQFQERMTKLAQEKAQEQGKSLREVAAEFQHNRQNKG